jgi:hypothetical protein
MAKMAQSILNQPLIIRELTTMIKPVGGRGKQAPYATTHLRVPVPIKEKLEAIIEDYRRAVVDGGESDPSTNSYDLSTGELEFIQNFCPGAVNDFKLIPLEQAKELAVKLLRSKSAKVSTVSKLLTGIYGEEVNEEDLK